MIASNKIQVYKKFIFLGLGVFIAIISIPLIFSLVRNNKKSVSTVNNVPLASAQPSASPDGRIEASSYGRGEESVVSYRVPIEYVEASSTGSTVLYNKMVNGAVASQIYVSVVPNTEKVTLDGRTNRFIATQENGALSNDLISVREYAGRKIVTFNYNKSKLNVKYIVAVPRLRGMTTVPREFHEITLSQTISGETSDDQGREVGKQVSQEVERFLEHYGLEESWEN